MTRKMIILVVTFVLILTGTCFALKPLFENHPEYANRGLCKGCISLYEFHHSREYDPTIPEMNHILRRVPRRRTTTPLIDKYHPRPHRHPVRPADSYGFKSAGGGIHVYGPEE